MLCGVPAPPSRVRLAEAAEAVGARMLWLDPHDVTDIGSLEPRPDVVLVRSGGFADDRTLEALARFEAAGVPALPGLPALDVARDKLAAARRLRSAGVATPAFLGGRVAESPGAVDDVLGGFPVVVKARRSMRGEGVMLATDPGELSDSLLQLGDDALVQAFVGDGSGCDVRVIVVGGHALGAVRRTPAPGEFRANAHQGASVVSRRLTDDLVEIAVRAAEALDVPVAGVDLMCDDGAWLVVEVNTSPGFDAFESATGVDVAAAIIGLALERSAAR